MGIDYEQLNYNVNGLVKFTGVEPVRVVTINHFVDASLNGTGCVVLHHHGNLAAADSTQRHESRSLNRERAAP